MKITNFLCIHMLYDISECFGFLLDVPVVAESLPAVPNSGVPEFILFVDSCENSRPK